MRAGKKGSLSALADEDAKDVAALRDGDARTGKSKHKLVSGSEGADTLKGGKGDDRIFGFDGKDKSGDVGAIRAKLIGSGFDGAVFASSAPGDPGRLYVLRKDAGEIHILDPASGQSSLFLNIPDGQFTSGGEQGVLGLAFHPGYAANGRFFVHMVNADGDLEIREYARSGNPNLANPNPVKTILTVPHPNHGNHNGGTVVFGPKDDYLYVTFGDGGGGNDPDGNGQNKNTLLGKILRLDVDGDDFPGNPGRNYAIPNDNPFVGKAGADEVWAYGLRNPWRIAFDENGDLYIGDVGQGAREEIDFQPASSKGGENYGWDLAEGSLGNPPAGSVLPVFEYGRDLGTVVTGGEVYRGDGPALFGAYFFTDFGSGRIWTLKNGAATERTSQIKGPEVTFVSSFGRDGEGNLYAVNLGGDIFLLTMKKHAGDLGDVLKGRGGDDRIYGGPGDDLLRGDGGADRLSGGFGDDLLRGGAGRDKLIGDEGADTFRFDVAPNSKNLDRVVDFTPGEDVISLRKSTFGAIGNALGDAAFHVGGAATTAAHRIVYNPSNGGLVYDKNGSADGGASRFARLDKGLDLDNGDFVVA
jgi:Ca2+-binding RTX toxin-like protein